MPLQNARLDSRLCPEPFYYRVYLRQQLEAYRLHHQMVLCPYNVTIEVIFIYLLYVINYVRSVGIVLDEPTGPSGLEDYIVHDLTSLDDTYDREHISETNELADHICEIVLMFYADVAVELRSFIIQPNQQFNIEITYHDDNYLWFEFSHYG